MTNITYNKEVGVGERLGTMLLDHLFMSLIAVIFFVPVLIVSVFSAYERAHMQTSPGFMSGPLGYIGMFGFALYFCKDAVNGRSIAKHILKLQVVDNSTGQAASPLQCLVRNLFCVLWPVEVIVAMINTGRRIGDRVAGTKLVYYNPSVEQPKVSFVKILLSVLIPFALTVLLIQLIPEGPMSKTGYSETSYNASESKELEKLLTDSLGQYLIPDIKVYDTIINSSLKYVSIVLNLKENYIAEENGYNRLDELTRNLIYTRFPNETITGRLKYVYRAPGQIQIMHETIGVRP